VYAPVADVPDAKIISHDCSLPGCGLVSN
jgi:hypothetical protein